RPPAPAVGPEVRHRVAPRLRPQLTLQGPVEPLDLALRLGAEGPAVDRPDVQPDQPGVEGRPPHGGVAGAEGVGAQQRFGRADVAPEGPAHGPARGARPVEAPPPPPATPAPVLPD